MIKIIWAAFVVLYVWFMIFFVPGPKPFGISVLVWGVAWLMPLGLLILLTATVVVAATVMRS